MEAKLLIQLFPHLKDSFDKDELPISFIVKRDSGRSKGKTLRSKSAAARKAAGQRMKKYWAARRRAKSSERESLVTEVAHPEEREGGVRAAGDNQRMTCHDVLIPAEPWRTTAPK